MSMIKIENLTFSYPTSYDRCGDWIEIISQSIYLKDCVV